MAANPLLYRNLYTLLGYFTNNDPRFEASLSSPTFNGSSFTEIQNELAQRFSKFAYKLDLSAPFNAEKFKGFLNDTLSGDEPLYREFYDKLEHAVWNNDWTGLEPETAQETAAEKSGQLPSAETANPEQVSDTAQKGGSPSLPNVGSPSFSSGSPRIVRQYPFRSGKEGGMGEGSAATSKINRFNAENPATAKINQQRLNQMPATVKSWRAQQGLGFKPSLTQVAQSPVGSAAKSLGSQLGIGARKLSTRAPGFVRGFLPGGNGGRNAGGLLNNFSRGRGGFGIPGFGSGGAGRGLLSRGGGILRNRGGGLVKSARSRWLIWLLLLLSLGGIFFGLFNPAQETKKLAVRVEKKGPDTVANGQIINYTINVTNTASASADIQVTDTLPLGLDFVDANPKPTKTADPLAGGAIVWTLNGVGANQTKLITLSVKPKPEFKDAWVQNNVKATSLNTRGGGGSGTSYGDVSGLLPAPLPPAPAGWEGIKAGIIVAFNKHPEVVENYKQASSATGIPWQVLAGLHFLETGGGPGPDSSLVSGRKIGQVEPDVPRSACASGSSEQGTPIPVGEGCGFANQLDSFIYGAKHLAGKVGKIPSTFQEVVTALSRYNGGGNANCGEGLPYGPCPPQFAGEDDPYAMSDFDENHARNKMYLIFCADRTRCDPPKSFGISGGMAVIRALSEQSL